MKEVDDTFFNEHLMDDVAEDVSESPAIHFDRKSPHATEDERKPPPASSFDGRNPDETSLKDYTTSVLQGRQFVITSRRISESTISMTMLYFYQSIFTKDITMMHQTRSLSRLNSLQGQALLLIVTYSCAHLCAKR